MVKLKCPICNKSYSKTANEFLKTKNPTCSRKCAGKSRSIHYIGKNNPHWKGGRPELYKGRFMVYAPGHPGAKLCNGTYILEYRLIAEKKVGRPLKDDEIVHHVNGDVTDNRLSNLEIMTQSEHCTKHMLDRHKKRREVK